MNVFLQLHRLSLRLDSWLSDWGWAILGLALRIFVAIQFFRAGLVKIKDWDSTLSLFSEEYAVPLLSPEVAAALAAAGELILPILLVIGLFSRPAAFALFAVNAMAVISYPQLWVFECPAAINDHLYWGLLLLVLAVVGAGKITVDQWIVRGNFPRL